MRKAVPSGPPAHRTRFRSATGFGRTLAAAAASLAVLAGPSAAVAATSTVKVSGPDPFASCDVSEQAGTVYPGTAVEPSLAVNPLDHNNVVGVWQQDRWSNGGAVGLLTGVSRDGGRTWSYSSPHFTRCSGGTAANGGDYERASDPWVTFAPNGDVYESALGITSSSASISGVLVAKSTDGGATWGEPVTLTRDDANVAPYLDNDKESITADPFDANYVYTVWDRDRFPSDQANVHADPNSIRGDIMFSRTTDGGRTWEPARGIFVPRDDEFVKGNQIEVLPDGTLVDVFEHGKGSANNRPCCDVSVMRSTDRGLTWSRPTTVFPEHYANVFDSDTSFFVRAGDNLPEIAVDRNPTSAGFGNLYVVKADSLADKPDHPNVIFSMSRDGGLTWTPAARVDKTPGAGAAFMPAVHVNADGTVGVAYYDFRNNDAKPGLPTDDWLLRCRPDRDCSQAASWSEEHVAGPFDLEHAPIVHGYFVGDYQSLASDGTSFLLLLGEAGATPGTAYVALARTSAG